MKTNTPIILDMGAYSAHIVRATDETYLWYLTLANRIPAPQHILNDGEASSLTEAESAARTCVEERQTLRITHDEYQALRLCDADGDEPANVSPHYLKQYLLPDGVRDLAQRGLLAAGNCGLECYYITPDGRRAMKLYDVSLEVEQLPIGHTLMMRSSKPPFLRHILAQYFAGRRDFVLDFSCSDTTLMIHKREAR